MLVGTIKYIVFDMEWYIAEREWYIREIYRKHMVYLTQIYIYIYIFNLNLDTFVN